MCFPCFNITTLGDTMFQMTLTDENWYKVSENTVWYLYCTVLLEGGARETIIDNLVKVGNMNSCQVFSPVGSSILAGNLIIGKYSLRLK